MNEAFYIGATGMQAQQVNVNTIANNLANVNTPGFKKSQISFTDLMAAGAVHNAVSPANTLDAGVMAAIPTVGAGVGITSVAKIFDQGQMQKTDSAMDVAIQGDGFLEVTLSDGSSGYVRGGTLKVGSDGLLATQSGFPLKPNISIPSNAQSMTITADGHVMLQISGQTTPVDAGQLQVVHFESPSLLSAEGDGVYRATEATGEPVTNSAGGSRVVQGFVEGSNVKMEEEMVNLMVAQRAYEASVKVVQSADEILSMVNNLRK